MTSDKQTEHQIMTPDEVSQELRIPKSTLYKLCQEGGIPAAKIGKHWRFDRTRVNQWLENQFAAQKDPGGGTLQGADGINTEQREGK